MSFIVFDKFFEGYDSFYDTKMGAFVDSVETSCAFELLDIKEGMKVLDVGCGTGNFSYKLAGKDCEVIGVDIAENMLSQARAKLGSSGGSISFFNMDASKLDFDDNTFDRIISITAFEFIPDPQAVYNEMKRVLKPDGIILIGTIQKGGAWADLYSSEVCVGTAYESAKFLSIDDLMLLDKSAVLSSGECLFVPQMLDENEYTPENELDYKAQNKTGGFVCVSFQKKA